MNSIEQVCDGLADKISQWDKSKRLLCIGHRDGDGITAACIGKVGMESFGFKKVNAEVMLSPSREKILKLISDNKPNYIITGDIGSSLGDIITSSGVDEYVITDHHPTSVYDEKYQVNPLMFGLDDEKDCSGSAMLFTLVKRLYDDTFWSTEPGRLMMALAVGGAVSDFMLVDGEFSINKEVVDMAVKYGAVNRVRDIRLFGRGMYPYPKAVGYADMPIFDSYSEQFGFFIDKGPPTKDHNNMPRRLVDLETEEKQLVLDLIRDKLGFKLSNDKVRRGYTDIVGYVYDIPDYINYDCSLNVEYDMRGTRTIDIREILHKVNYLCRQGGHKDAITYLTVPKLSRVTMNAVHDAHSVGDTILTDAMMLLKNGDITIDFMMDGKLLFMNYGGSIYFDMVGIVGGMAMKNARKMADNIGIELEHDVLVSMCAAKIDPNEIANPMFKCSIRADKEMWLYSEPDGEMSDAVKVMKQTAKTMPEQVGGFGGHRWACSSYMEEDALDVFTAYMQIYMEDLLPPTYTDEIPEDIRLVL